MKPILAALAFLLLVAVPARAQQVGTCSPSLGEGYLDINNVRARILNNGNLFYRGEPHVYNIPKGSSSNAIFAGGIWLGGQVGGALRVAATRYGPYEFWAGPLDEAGNAPADCGRYDRIYKVSKRDVARFEESGTASPDLADWPTGLGAPTIDADGNDVNLLSQPLAARRDRKINLAAGERPKFLGDQMLWWVMNDMGNTHNDSDADPIGAEVHGLAFAFDAPGDIGNTTFYKYNIFYKGRVPLTDTYMGIFSDPDMGDFGDDWVGSEPTRGVGYVWNSDNFDGGGEGYGTPPPAVGYDFFQGPIVPSPGDVAHVSGREVPNFKNLGMTSFVFYNNGGGVTEDPGTAEDYYNYMQARWKDGKPITYGGNGRDFSDTPTKYMFDGDAANCGYWTECNSDGAGAKISPGDRRFVLSTGPFTINPGDQQEIVYGIVYGMGTDNFNSVTRMLQADELAQAAFDVNFDLADPPSTPEVSVTALDGQIVLEWTNGPRSNNYLESYRQLDPFAPPGSYFEFQGYDVYQYADIADQVGKVIATYDKVDNVKQVLENIPGQPGYIGATGRDSGVQTYHSIGGLVNYKEYYFGVQAYAYNETSLPKVFRSTIARVVATPAPPSATLSESAQELAFGGTLVPFAKGASNIGQGVVTARVVNPAALKNATYTVEFYPHPSATAEPFGRVAPMEEIGIEDPVQTDFSASKGAAAGCLTYDIKRDGEVVFNGKSGNWCAPQRQNVIVIDGLLFSVTGPPPGIAGFNWVKIKGVDQTDACGSFQFNGSGFPATCTSDRPPASFPWGIHAGGAQIPYGPASDGTSFLGRATRGAGVGSQIGAQDFEIRFTDAATNGNTPKGWRAFQDGAVMNVPFEVWNIGVGTPNNTADDIRLVPAILDNNTQMEFDQGGDHAISGGANDPLTDWIYFYHPDADGDGNDDTTPGQAGYESFMFGPGDVHTEVFARLVFVCFNCGTAPPYPQGKHPDLGSVWRITTLKPNNAGDIFTLNTGAYDSDGDGTPEALGAEPKDYTGADSEELLAGIGVSPNPYKGASAYEKSQLIDEVRFTGLPETATIRIFTLNGTLIRTLEKAGPGRTLPWDLTTNNQLPIASGMYLVHVELPGGLEKVIKFAVIKKRVHLNVF